MHKWNAVLSHRKLTSLECENTCPVANLIHMKQTSSLALSKKRLVDPTGEYLLFFFFQV